MPPQIYVLMTVIKALQIFFITACKCFSLFKPFRQIPTQGFNSLKSCFSITNETFQMLVPLQRAHRPANPQQHPQSLCWPASCENERFEKAKPQRQSERRQNAEQAFMDALLHALFLSPWQSSQPWIKAGKKEHFYLFACANNTKKTIMCLSSRQIKFYVHDNK